ncbi:hypothetical protein AB0J86_11645, partial [Micromonospora sp. NPDC049559]|uniref:hypothetical protein n=1 Tax=Micromonospora sp. NPDC049559 TaxID=3155923 RepID=UPI003434DDAB
MPVTAGDALWAFFPALALPLKLRHPILRNSKAYGPLLFGTSREEHARRVLEARSDVRTNPLLSAAALAS